MKLVGRHRANKVAIENLRHLMQVELVSPEPFKTKETMHPNLTRKVNLKIHKE